MRENPRERVRVIIIPNDEVTDKGIFYASMKNGYHPFLLQKACVKYGVSPYEEYESLINAGHIVITMEDRDTLYCWFPNSLTEKQKTTFRKFRKVFTHFRYMEFTSWDSNDFHIYTRLLLRSDEMLDELYKKFEEYFKKNRSI